MTAVLVGRRPSPPVVAARDADEDCIPEPPANDRAGVNVCGGAALPFTRESSAKLDASAASACVPQVPSVLAGVGAAAATPMMLPFGGGFVVAAHGDRASSSPSPGDAPGDSASSSPIQGGARRGSPWMSRTASSSPTVLGDFVRYLRVGCGSGSVVASRAVGSRPDDQQKLETNTELAETNVVDVALPIGVPVMEACPSACSDIRLSNGFETVGPLLQPLPSVTETFWSLRPPSTQISLGESFTESLASNVEKASGESGQVDDRGPDKGHDSDVALHKSDMKPSGTCFDAFRGGKSCFLSDSRSRAQCRECELPRRLASGRRPRRRDCVLEELTTFGIEREFEFGGNGWVKSAADLQPQRSVFFPEPPVHACQRVYHIGHHAKWRRRITCRGGLGIGGTAPFVTWPIPRQDSAFAVAVATASVAAPVASSRSRSCPTTQLAHVSNPETVPHIPTAVTSTPKAGSPPRRPGRSGVNL
eukprot:TRINITY_DN62873_c0_g1_i1.p1 TRINITY_DN62873_c0_g1~~TRINITY_DN62873_c0_g1_i1.p1  ORF type:complete len:477 (+),score=59.29 TRINITY_DN62873_c0_g1_i1:100-1530(+)